MLDEATGRMIQRADQSKTCFAFGFERAKALCTPVAVIGGMRILDRIWDLCTLTDFF